MKRILIILMTGCLFIIGSQMNVEVIASAKQELEYPVVEVKVKGACNDDICGEGYNIDGTTYVPIRVVLESMGATVLWSNTNEKQIVEVVRGENNGNQDDEKLKLNKIFISEIEILFLEIKQELDLLASFDQHIILAYELYKTDNDFQWINQLSNWKIIEHKNKVTELMDNSIKFVENYQDIQPEVIKLTKIAKQIREIVDYYQFTIQTLEKYISTNQSSEFKQFLLHRKIALEMIEVAKNETLELNLMLFELY